MKVMMNLSPLGGRFKTGIFRVSEELCRGVAARLGHDLTFHILNSPKGSRDYYETHLASTGARLILRDAALPFFPITDAIETFVWATAPNRSLHYRLTRRVLMELQRSFEKYAGRVPDEWLAEHDIYHSPFLPIPPEVRRCGRILKFTTVYDLLPITNPELFPASTVSMMKVVMGNFTEEDHTFCISKATRDALLENTPCQPERTFVVPLAAAAHFHPVPAGPDRDRTLAKYGIPRGNFILSLSTFEIRKNLQAVIRAFCRLLQEQAIPADTLLVLVGPKGWKDQEIARALEETPQARDKIVMPGFVPDADLAAIYSAARVFAYMSILEGFGLPPLEAMQCGTPAITSNTSSLPEVMGTSGTMLEPHDFDGLCDAIQRHYSDDGFHEKMASNALQRANCFSWDEYISRTLEIYRMSLEGRGT